tara:strand:- start:1451 stop:1690 length:240 start_codon:yes stop_codon:yes gene_type:complete
MRNFYPQGYMPKIEYWTSKLNAEVMNTKVPDIQVISNCLSKLEYFTKRQMETQSPPDRVIAGVDFGESLDMLCDLGLVK